MPRSPVEVALGASGGADCGVCRNRLHRGLDGGWIHAEGGAVMMHCEVCGTMAAPPPPAARCPKCGSINAWLEHHVASAVRD